MLRTQCWFICSTATRCSLTRGLPASSLAKLTQRDGIIGLLRGLPQATVATDDGVLRLIGRETLYATGIGYVDAQLLAATRLTSDAKLWTRDKSLSAASARLGLTALMN